LTCKDCGKKDHHVAEDRGQGVVKGKEWKELKKCRGCAEKGKKKAACPAEGKAQQSSTRARDLEGAAKERGREVQRTFKMLKKVWLNIGIERTDTHKGVTIKVLLDSSDGDQRELITKQE